MAAAMHSGDGRDTRAGTGGWQVETNLRHLKQTMGLDVLHCQHFAGVMKELTVFALVYNLVRIVMLEAAKRQGVALERISFIDALRWLSTASPGAACRRHCDRRWYRPKSCPIADARRDHRAPFGSARRGHWRGHYRY
jgi:hypothetical protein